MNTRDSSADGETKNFPTLAKFGPSLGRWSARCLLWMFGLAVLYMLSIGPAVQLNKRGLISSQTFEKIYFPLSLISDIPGSHWILDRYMRLWADPHSGNGQ
jgi:hypothetical protein